MPNRSTNSYGIILIYSLVIFPSLASCYSYYFEKCTENLAGECSCRNGLTLDKSTMTCLPKCEQRIGWSSFYDSELDQCFLKLDLNTTKYSHSKSEMELNSVSCPPNSHFVTSNYKDSRGLSEFGNCICDDTFSRSRDWDFCIPENLLKYGEACTTACDPIAGLFCINGVCGCRNTSIWNPEDSLCYSEADCRRRFPLSMGIKWDPEVQRCTSAVKKICNTRTKYPIHCPKNSRCLEPRYCAQLEHEISQNVFIYYWHC